MASKLRQRLIQMQGMPMVAVVKVVCLSGMPFVQQSMQCEESRGRGQRQSMGSRMGWSCR